MNIAKVCHNLAPVYSYLLLMIFVILVLALYLMRTMLMVVVRTNIVRIMQLMPAYIAPINSFKCYKYCKISITCIGSQLTILVKHNNQQQELKITWLCCFCSSLECDLFCTVLILWLYFWIRLEGTRIIQSRNDFL